MSITKEILTRYLDAQKDLIAIESVDDRSAIRRCCTSVPWRIVAVVQQAYPLSGVEAKARCSQGRRGYRVRKWMVRTPMDGRRSGSICSRC